MWGGAFTQIISLSQTLPYVACEANKLIAVAFQKTSSMGGHVENQQPLY